MLDGTMLLLAFTFIIGGGSFILAFFIREYYSVFFGVLSLISLYIAGITLATSEEIAFPQVNLLFTMIGFIGFFVGVINSIMVMRLKFKESKRDPWEMEDEY
jgi:hypothetical protein